MSIDKTQIESMLYRVRVSVNSSLLLVDNPCRPRSIPSSTIFVLGWSSHGCPSSLKEIVHVK